MSQAENKTLHIGINNCRDWYDKLKFEHARLVTSQYKEKYDILNFLITAYHLNDDWLSKDEEMRPQLAITKRGRAPLGMREIVQAIKDLANGNKHFVLDKKSDEKRVVEAVHAAAYESSFYSYFLGPHFGIKIGQSFYTIPVLVDLIMSYFEWIFDDSISESKFPVKLSEAIKRAAMLERVRIVRS